VTGTSDRVVVTGTPGTGKSTATALLADAFDVIHLNELIEDDPTLWTDRDATRDTLTADLEAIRERLGDWSGILESHLAHHFAADRVVVLRCHPETLVKRLQTRGESSASIDENAEAEALDVILSEAVAEHGTDRVYEVDTTDRSPEAVAKELRTIAHDEATPRAGTVDFTAYL
jgi:adenylate kinase